MMFDGAEITGAVVSTIEIVCVFDDELPQASVAVHVRTNELELTHEPATDAASEYVTVGAASQLSVAVAAPVAAGSVDVLH